MDVRAEVERLLRRGMSAQPHPLFPGAVAQVALRGDVLPAVAVGEAVRWADQRHLLADGERLEMTADTVFDLASLTKAFTAVVALRVLPRHGIRLDDRVADVLGEYAVRPRSEVTWRHLLTHTSGLPACSMVWQLEGSPDERCDRLLATRLEAEPGTRHEYSCVGYITAGIALERLTGRSLDRLLTQEVTAPLGLADTAYPCSAGGAAAQPVARVAATEFEPGRGMVRGEVHDELAWSLGMACGNAGIFSTAVDLLSFGLALSAPEGPLLDHEARLAATTDQRPPGVTGDYGQAVGLRIGDPGLLPGMPHWCGHTGFTGTALVLQPGTGTVGVLLTNRVHPSRSWSDLGPTRRQFSRLLHRAA